MQAQNVVEGKNISRDRKRGLFYSDFADEELVLGLVEAQGEDLEVLGGGGPVGVDRGGDGRGARERGLVRREVVRENLEGPLSFLAQILLWAVAGRDVLAHEAA